MYILGNRANIKANKASPHIDIIENSENKINFLLRHFFFPSKIQFDLIIIYTQRSLWERMHLT